MNSSTAIPGNLDVSKCATEMQMLTRTDWLFKSNVYLNDLLAVITAVLTVIVMRNLAKRCIFTDSTNILIWFSLFVVNIHQLVYAYIQNWSLYRSIVFYNDPCKIMFNEYECFNWYTANIFVRLVMICSMCALTIDRLLSLFIPRIPASNSRGAILSLIAIAAAFFFCTLLTSDGPNENIQSNCFQRQGRNIDELKWQILFYLKVVGACFGLTIFAWIFGWRSLKNRQFNVQQQLSKRESYNSSIVIFIILSFQMFFLAFYSLSIVFLLEWMQYFPPTMVTNLVLWFYTYTYAALSLPFGIWLSTKFISFRRRKEIKDLTNTNATEKQEDYFEKLNQAWSNGYENGRQSTLPQVEGH